MSLLTIKAVNCLVGAETHKFTLPIPPTANLIWRNSYVTGRTYKNPKYVSWQRAVSLIVPKIPTKDKKKWDLDVRFFFYFVKKTSNMDIDNRLKPLVDLFRDKIEIDDRYLMNISAERVDVKAPKVRKDHYCEVVLTIY